jgi:hypothetical protein
MMNGFFDQGFFQNPSRLPPSARRSVGSDHAFYVRDESDRYDGIQVSAGYFRASWMFGAGFWLAGKSFVRTYRWRKIPSTE